MKPGRVLLLPGWLDSDAEHWQSRWERCHGYTRVVQSDWLWPRRGDWMARLEEVLLGGDAPALLVAHSLGCHLVAAWAAHSRHVARVSGALGEKTNEGTGVPLGGRITPGGTSRMGAPAARFTEG